MDKRSAISWVKEIVPKEDLMRVIEKGEEYTDTFEHKGKTVILTVQKDYDDPSKLEVMFSRSRGGEYHFSLTLRELGIRQAR